MNQIRRYPGANPFSSDQKDLFFGRQEDINNLFEFISLSNLSVLYAKSGLGKSSLINAGMVPKVLAETALEVYNVRFGAYTEDSPAMPLKRTQLTLQQPQLHPKLAGIIPDEQSLWYWLKNRQLQQMQANEENYEGGFLLVFDQFEELFTYPTEAIEDFARQLSELINTTIPKRFRDALSQQHKRQENGNGETFINQLHTPFEIRILMAIRSDRMSLLNQLKSFFPLILKNCYELKELSVIQAEDAILNPAYLPGAHFQSPNFDYEDAAVEKIINFLTQDGSQPIASFQLQIICESVEDHVIRTGDQMIQAEDLGDLQEVYTNYYMNQLRRIEDPAERLAARRLIEEGLVFEEEERRLSIYEGQILKTFNVSPPLLRKLVDSHLLRAEPSLQGGYTYELSHDTLVAPVLKAKKERLFEERRAAEEAARLERERELEALRKEAEEERKKRRRARAFAGLWFLLAALSLVTSFIAFRQFRIANVAKTVAQEQELLAKEQQKIAEEQRGVALSMTEQAQKSESLAEQRLEEALSSRAEALTARAQAERALVAAERSERQAIFERDRAEKARQQISSLEFNNNISRLIKFAYNEADDDPNQALRIIEAAFLLKDTSITRNALRNIHYNYPLTNTLWLNNPHLGCNDVEINPEGNLIAGAFDYGVTAIWRSSGKLDKVFVDREGSGYISDVEFSSDSKQLVTASSDDRIRIWNVDNGTLASYFDIDDREVYGMRLSEDNQYLAIVSDDSLFQVIDLARDTNYFGVGHTQPLIHGEVVNFSDSIFALSYSKSEFIIWDRNLNPSYRIAPKSGHTFVKAGVFSNSSRIYYFDNESNILTFDPPYQQPVYERKLFDKIEITQAIFSNNDLNHVAVVDDENRLKVYDFESERTKTLPPFDSDIQEVLFLPDYQSESEIDNIYLMVALKSGHLQVVNWNTPLFYYFRGYGATITSGEFSRDNRYFLTASYDSLAVVWDLNDNTPAIIKHPSKLEDVAWLNDHNTFVTSCEDSIARVYHVNGELIASLSGHTEKVRKVMVSNKGHIIATTSGDQTCKLWDANTFKLITTLEGHQSTVMACTFTPDDQYIITMGYHGLINLWSTDGTFIKTIVDTEDVLWDIAIHPTKNLLVTGFDNGKVVVFDFDGNEVLNIGESTSPVYAVSFSPDGNVFAAGLLNGIAKMWDLEGSSVGHIDYHRGNAIFDVGFSNNGLYFYSTSSDRRVKFWQFDHERMINGYNSGTFFGGIPNLAENFKSIANIPELDTIDLQRNQFQSFNYPDLLQSNDTINIYHFAKFYQRSGEAAQENEAGKFGRLQYRKSLELYSHLINITDDPYYLNNYGDVEFNLGTAYFESEVYDTAYILSEAALEIYDVFYKEDPDTYASSLSNKYGTSSYYALFVRQPQQAIEKGLRGLELDPSQLWIKTNLGHGYLYTNQFDKAMETYQSLLDKPTGDPEQSFKDILEEDFMELEKRGINHPDLNRARTALGITRKRENRIQGN